MGNDYWETKNAMDVSEYYIHESYNAITQKGDIAVLKLTHPHPHVIPVCLPSKPWNKYDGRRALAAGFGWNENNEYPDKLMMTDVAILTNKYCRKNHLWGGGIVVPKISKFVLVVIIRS